jgi:hypothetical protein
MTEAHNILSKTSGNFGKFGIRACLPPLSISGW